MTAQPPAAGEIRLPRSRVVLTKDDRFTLWKSSVPDLRQFILGPEEDHWAAWADGGHGDFTGTQDECVAWLDRRVDRLRRALAPEGATEIIAKWLVENGRDRYGRDWDETPECQRDDARALARDLLAALGMKP